jgi:DNA-binding transcriptional MocR family regulator
VEHAILPCRPSGREIGRSGPLASAGRIFHAGTPDRATLRLSVTANTPAQTSQGLSRLRVALGG